MSWKEILKKHRKFPWWGYVILYGTTFAFAWWILKATWY